MSRLLPDHPSVAGYIIGFQLSLITTLGAYLVVVRSAADTTATIAAILIFAITQLFVQLYFFLHVGKEKGPRWQLTFLAFALVVVAILVLGSLWIMANLNYNMMSPTERDTYILTDEGFDDGSHGH